VNGGGPEELVLKSELDKSLEDWTSDGQFLLFNQLMPGSRREVWKAPLHGKREPSAVFSGPSSTFEAQVSPDRHWIAYTTLESGSREIYVQNFPPTGGKWQISTKGGRQPAWRRDGRELFYMEGEKLMAVDIVARTNRFEASVPKPLFSAPIPTILRNVYVVSPDGQKFLFVMRPNSANVLPIEVVLNWRANAKPHP